jgi:ribosomal protein S18 acetylase RimI-like enzyme
MNIRPAAAADRERIHEILVATGRFTPQEVGWAMELVDLATRQSQSEYTAAVAEDGEIQGYVLYGPTPMTEGVFDLYWIAVDPKYQGHGVGQVLLRFVETEVRRQAGRMLLIETSSKRSYAPTIRFYQNAGYREISRIKDFYRIEDDKVVFCKHLAAS